jgi:hypothetical protein
MARIRDALLLLAALVVAGCTGSQGETYLGLPGSPAWFATASSQTVADYYGQRCVSYGFKPGTVEMAQCIQSEAQGGRGAASARMAAAANNRPKNTTCTGFGNMVNCTTY